MTYTCFIFQKLYNTMLCFFYRLVSIFVVNFTEEKNIFGDEKSTEYVIHWKFIETLCEYTTLLKQLQSFT